MRTLRYAHSFEVVSELPVALQPLKKLAMNFRWTWEHGTQRLFEEVDPQLWESVEHNPMELINRLSPERKKQLVDDAIFLAKLDICEKGLDEYMASETWYDRRYPGKRANTRIAYFCAEFGVNESLPIYSGGLGVLAGDHLKAASDLGIPLVGVGLLYSRGYFRQYLDTNGWQQEHYPNYDFYRLPLQLLRGEDDQPLRVQVEFPDRTVTCQLWKAQIGRVPLYLLDSNVLDNIREDQGITDTLYGGDENMRIRQEMILGIGGMRALRAVGINPTVCHMNEGHAAFLTLERLRQFMAENNCDFRTARQVVVSGNVFTTHTPVPAGFDIFHEPLLRQYLTKTISNVGLSFDDFIRLGRIDPNNKNEPFNMAVLAMENANYVNGVSKLHAKVTREMFNDRWPDYPVEEVPVDAVTNGIHTMTWLSKRFADLLDRHLGNEWREDPSAADVWERAAQIPDHDLWEMRENQRGDFVRFVRKRLLRNLTKRNAAREELNRASGVLDPRILTIGFARRFATYKRASLLFTDRERLKALLNHPERPIQIVFAGKSHPRDDGGKRLIQDIWNFIHHEGGRTRMVFMEDYDMEVARTLVQGVDVWLNNPRRPMEASGTSGMKVVPNAGLNCSVLDGWWAEGWAPGTGWAIGTGDDVADHGHQDWLDSQSLYQLLESEIAPLFYSRNDAGIPVGWLELVRRSMRELAPVFSTARMVREYATRFYMPASESYERLQSDGLKKAKDALVWRDRVRAAWDSVAIKSVTNSGRITNAIGDSFKIVAEVNLGNLQPEDVHVQVLLGEVGANRELVELEVNEMKLQKSEGGSFYFEADVHCDSAGHRGYVVRVVPFHEDVRVASELSLVCWQSAV